MKLEQALQTTKFKNEAHKATLHILYAAWWIKTIGSKELKEFGLTHEQYNVLRILKGKHPDLLCVKEIGNRMIEQNSNVPRIVDRLVLKKLVKRQNAIHDKRETVVNITAAGLTILEACTVAMEKVMNSKINLNEKDALAINRILENMREEE